jgi:hypothetical protein
MAFITDEQARGMAEMVRQRAEADPAFAEDITSVNESMPFIVQMYEGTPPIRCECCGTLVTQCPEAEASAKPWTYKPAIWELEMGRKHTLRRCEWLRDNGGIEATGWKPGDPPIIPPRGIFQ